MSRTLPAAEPVGVDGLTATERRLKRAVMSSEALAELNKLLRRRGSPLRFQVLLADAPHASLFLEPTAVNEVT